MKEFKGTPGPWHVSDEGCVVIRDDYFFSHVASNIGYPSDEEDMANANLIASSPELLSALQQLLEIYDDNSGKVWTTSSKRRALDGARDAVNKALEENQ
ncbi:hypothetical protein V2H33_22085 [Escherichia coli]|uniref:hypothetical protein n=1 Tax=Escherichia coli TaxID=562 RepID=UPI002EB7F5E7|nr:hypothetical protein [Escherichia coli]